MDSESDPTLLRAYLSGSEAAFGRLVARYLALVHAAARRQTRDSATAEDVTQAVFIILARKASTLTSKPILAGWLVQTARYCATDARKFALRRDRREQEAAAMRSAAVAPVQSTAGELDEYLDAALAAMSASDRDVLSLHYLQGQTLPIATQGMLGLVVNFASDARIRIRQLDLTLLQPTEQQLRELRTPAAENWRNWVIAEQAAGRSGELSPVADATTTNRPISGTERRPGEGQPGR